MAAFGEQNPSAGRRDCVVNGPGEARDAGIGIAAGNKRGHLFGEGPERRSEDEMVDTLVEWAEFIHEHSADAALEKAKATRMPPTRHARGPRPEPRRAREDASGRGRDRRDPSQRGLSGEPWCRPPIGGSTSRSPRCVQSCRRPSQNRWGSTSFSPPSCRVWGVASSDFDPALIVLQPIR